MTSIYQDSDLHKLFWAYEVARDNLFDYFQADYPSGEYELDFEPDTVWIQDTHTLLWGLDVEPQDAGVEDFIYSAPIDFAFGGKDFTLFACKSNVGGAGVAMILANQKELTEILT